MATETVSGICEETDREMERFRMEVAIAKEELRVRFEYYYQRLREKHLELVAQLDEVVRAAETQVEERQVQLNQLTVTRAEVSQNLQHNELNETLKKVSGELNEKIQRLEASGDRIPSVWLGWMDECLESGIAGLCHVCQGVSYVNRHNPVWSGVNEGKGNIKIFSPFDLSIDGENGDIFVCDHGADRIQVFSKEGNYSRTIEPPGMSRPSFIAVSPRHLFVSCSPHSVYKLDKASGDTLCCVGTVYATCGLSVDTTTLYIGMYGTNCISHFSAADLRSLHETLLNSPHITEDTRLCDLKLAPLLFIVLFHKCSYPVQSFSKDGSLIHSIVSHDQLICGRYLCLDRHMNIIISDYGAHNVKVFNREGQLVTAIGHEGTEPGEFDDPQGIDVSSSGLIVVVDLKDSHKLQFF